MTPSALRWCLKDIKSKNGALTEWNEVSRACTVFGIKLPQYLLESGLWRFIAAATDVNPSLRFREADYAWAVSERLPRASPEVIAFEAKKLMMLMTGVRRLLDQKYKLPKKAKNLMEAIVDGKTSNRITQQVTSLKNANPIAEQ